MILVAGATGMLGSQIVRRLLEQGREVRILVRLTSDHSALVAAGAQPVEADFKDPGSLAAAVRGVETVVTTANSARRPPPDTVEAVDLHGNRHLVEASAVADVGHFIFLSAAGSHSESPVPFLAAKGLTEDRLRAGLMPWTIVVPQPYIEVWVEMVVAGPALSGGEVAYIGSGERRHSMISVHDVAQFVVASIDNPAAHHRRLEIGGPEPITWKDAVAAFERVLGRPIPQRGVPPGEPVPGIPEPVMGLLASLDTYDSAIDSTELAKEFGVRQISLDAYARRRVAAS